MRTSRAGPKGFVRYLFPFELTDDYEIDEILTILTTSLEATKERLPLLACEAVPDTKSNREVSSNYNMEVLEILNPRT